MKNNLEEVKIIYCFDENKAALHYSKTVKGNSYYCIDCGSELICKEGKKKIKHLAHKNTLHCGGTGESIFHKHWKENLFKAGMFINVANRISKPENVEILEVLNEVTLNDRYNTNWDIRIIVDVLLITDKGDIIIEINYKNPKDWSKLKSYYGELDILRVYEVTVDKHINTTLKWFCLGEEEEIKRIKDEQKKIENNKRLEAEQIKEERKLEREKKKLDKKKAELMEFNNKIRSGEYKEIKLYFNFNNVVKNLDDNNFYMQCMYEKKPNQYEPINIKFVHNKVVKKATEIKQNFSVSYGIKYCFVIVDNTHNVIKFNKSATADYNKRLYAQLCNIK